jgi:ABC-type branched-subunit amino acid transport system substrate-binding protein
MLKSIGYERVLLLHSDDAYGNGGYREIVKAAYNSGVCVSGRISLPHYGTSARYQDLLRNIMSYGVTAVVFYGGAYDTFTVMQVRVWIF